MGQAGDDADIVLLTIVPARDGRNRHAPGQTRLGQVSAKGGHRRATGRDPRGRTWGPNPTALSAQGPEAALAHICPLFALRVQELRLRREVTTPLALGGSAQGPQPHPERGDKSDTRGHVPLELGQAPGRQ